MEKPRRSGCAALTKLCQLLEYCGLRTAVARLRRHSHSKSKTMTPRAEEKRGRKPQGPQYPLSPCTSASAASPALMRSEHAVVRVFVTHHPPLGRGNKLQQLLNCRARSGRCRPGRKPAPRLTCRITARKSRRASQEQAVKFAQTEKKGHTGASGSVGSAPRHRLLPPLWADKKSPPPVKGLYTAYA